MKTNKVIAGLVAVAILTMGLSACSKDALNTQGKDFTLDINQANPEELKLPLINPPEKITIASTISATVAGQTIALSDVKALKELEKRSGVQAEFQTTTVEKLNLLFASDNLPDMIFTDWQTIGGTYKYAMDQQIIPLDELISKNSPNFINVLKKDDEIQSSLMDIDGKIYHYPFLRLTENLRVFEGYQIRRDWLEKLGLKMPETIDEYYTVLKAFKEKDPNGNGEADEIPFISDKKLSGVDKATSWWGIDNFYQVDGTVKCGWLQPEYKEYISTLGQWYKEGLIDPDYLTVDTKQFNSKVVNELSGSFYGRAAGVLGNLQKMMASINDEFELAALPWLSKDGTNGQALVSKYNEKVLGIGFAITSNCQKPDLAAKWADYAYSDDGHLLFNFGIEGESYTMENGIPTYTKEITANPNGLAMNEALAGYAIPGNYAFVQSEYYFDQFMTGLQKSAIDVWKKGSADRALPTLKYTSDEIMIANNKMNEIKTYVAEMQNKFITGKEPIENYDAFIDQIKKMGIEEVVKTMQGAYDRYNLIIKK